MPGQKPKCLSAPCRAVGLVFCRQSCWRGRIQSKGVRHCKHRCALINSPNKYFRGSRHRASKNAEQQALWRPPWTEWTGVGVGQRPSWLSGALAAQVSHLLGPFPAPGSPRCPPSVAQKGCHGASSLLLEEPWHLP